MSDTRYAADTLLRVFSVILLCLVPLSATAQTNNYDYDLGSTPFPLTAYAGEPFLIPFGSGLENISVEGLQFSYNFNLSSGTLPPGITFSPTGDLAGTPTTPGEYKFGLHWTFIYSYQDFTFRYQFTYDITMTVLPGFGPALYVSPGGLDFSLSSTGQPASQPVVVGNQGGTVLTYTTSASTSTTPSWLSVSGGGTVQPYSSGTVTVTANPSGLASGTYLGTVTIQSNAGDSETVHVLLTLRSGQPELSVSRSGLTFIAAAGVPNVPTQTFAVLNTGDGNINWRATPVILSGSDWLTVTPASGTSNASTSPEVTVKVSANLPAGDYYGQVAIAADGVANSPVSVSVVFSVAAAATNVLPTISPSGVVFVGRAGGANPAVQKIAVGNVSTQPVTISSTNFFQNGKDWFTVSPVGTTIQPGQTQNFTVQINTAGLTPAVYTGEIAFRLPDGTIQRVYVVLVVLPAGPSTAERQAAGCTPTKLIPVFTTLGAGFKITAAWPSPIEMLVVDDCGDPVSSGAVRVSFSSADSEIALTPLQNGRWSGTWKGLNQGDIGVTLTADAQELTPNLTGRAQIAGNMQANAVTPLIASGGAVSAGNFSVASLLAPGSLVSIYGQNFGAVQVPTTLPLPITLGGTEVALGGKRLPLLYTSDGQINAMIPFDLKPDTTYQLVVRRGTSVSVPEPVHLASSQPAAFLLDTNGLGIVVVAPANGSAPYLAGPGSPAHAGDYLVIYCVGLGAVSETVVAGDASPFSPLAQTLLPVSVSIGGKPANVVFSGLTPGLSGLYQVNVVVPEGVAGPSVKVVLTEAGLSSSAITIPIQ